MESHPTSALPGWGLALNSKPMILTAHTGAEVMVDDSLDLSPTSGRIWINSGGYAVVYHKAMKRTIGLHQLVLPGVGMIDHIDGDKLNNRRANLRACTPVENTLNRRVRGYNRVKLRSGREVYRVRIGPIGKRVELGYFGTPEEAQAAYRAFYESTGGAFQPRIVQPA